MMIPRTYKPAPRANVGEEDRTSIMGAEGNVAAVPAELTTQSESSVFTELRTVFSREIATAGPGFSSCSEIQRRYISCLIVLPRAMALITVAYGVRPRIPLPATVEA